jgi:S-DNA-T family DNA segregation ATPase FtsK/SpoIIIE
MSKQKSRFLPGGKRRKVRRAHPQAAAPVVFEARSRGPQVLTETRRPAPRRRFRAEAADVAARETEAPPPKPGRKPTPAGEAGPRPRPETAAAERVRSQGRKKIADPQPGFARVYVFGSRVRKYLNDLVAVGLLALAVITLISLTGLSTGTLVEPWARFVREWFGWGAVIVPVTLGAIGASILLHTLGRLPRVRWGRVIAAEGAVFLGLALFNLFIGRDLLRAAAGEGGGVIGWSIGEVSRRVLAPADPFVLGLLFLIALALAVDVTANRIERLGQWLAGQGFDRTPAGQLELPFDEAGPESAASRRAERKAVEEPRKRQIKPSVRVPVETVTDELKGKGKKRDKRLPELTLLDMTDLRRPAQKDIDANAAIIIQTLGEFGVPVNVIGARIGPSVTQFQVEPGFVAKPGPDGISKQWKIRVAQIASLHNDLALALSATTLRIEAPVPGSSYVGIEVPHRRTSTVGLRPVMESEQFQKIHSPLKVALGRDVSGAAVAADLGKMPHLLIAGTTGSGKSVAITAMISCLIMNNTPDDLRLVMVDPKMVELVRFNGVPHLYGKVETEVTRVLGVLRWTVREMERRYKVFEEHHVRNIDTYTAKTARKKDAERLPRMVVFIDELADLMMQAPDETERIVVRLAQMARATGIHMVVATQRPSTDVVTGLIKANFPARIAFAVTSGIDSRVILDSVGAESLLGKGDMLFQSPEAQAPARIQGCFISDGEIDRVVDWWKEQADLYREALQPKVEDDDVPTIGLGPNVPDRRREASERRPEAPSRGAEASAAPTGGAPSGRRPAAEDDHPPSAPRPIPVSPQVRKARPPANRPKPAPEPEPVAGNEPAPWDEMLAREQAVADKDGQIEQAIEIVKKHGTASASLLQRKMRIGYPRAARLLDELKQMGLIGREQAGGKTREVFMDKGDDPIGERAKRILDGDDDE